MGVGAAEVLLCEGFVSDGGKRGGGGGQAHHSMPFKADDDGVDVVLVQLRLEFGAGALRVEKSIANAQVGRGVQTGDGNVNRSAKQSKSENEQADEGEGGGVEEGGRSRRSCYN